MIINGDKNSSKAPITIPMKRLYMILLAALLVLGLTACGAGGGEMNVDIQAAADAIRAALEAALDA